jgi:pimeloyl-ACP methyl ester carboxylesterase
MTHPFQLIMVPGLNCDHRLLEPQREEFPQMVVPAWIPSRHNESLPDYAARLAETVKPSSDAPLILGGVSFGGMVACEMARHLKPKAVVVIASCRGPQGLRPTYRALRGLLPLVPVRTWDVLKLLATPTVMLADRVSPAQRDVLVRMFQESDSYFSHWVIHAILHWELTPMDGIRVLQIHGRHDRVLPARRAKADEIIADGGHMINVTHAKQVNAFIRRAGQS